MNFFYLIKSCSIKMNQNIFSSKPWLTLSKKSKKIAVGRIGVIRSYELYCNSKIIIWFFRIYEKKTKTSSNLIYVWILLKINNRNNKVKPWIIQIIVNNSLSEIFLNFFYLLSEISCNLWGFFRKWFLPLSISYHIRKIDLSINISIKIMIQP